MATDTDGRSGPDVRVVLEHGARDNQIQHRQHHQGIKSEASFIKAFERPCNNSFGLGPRAVQDCCSSSQDVAETVFPTIHTCNRPRSSRTAVASTALAGGSLLICERVVKPSGGRNRRFHVRRLIKKWVIPLCPYLHSRNTTSRSAPNKPTSEHNNSIILNQQGPFYGSEYHTNIQDEGPCIPNLITQAISNSEDVLMMESDRQSMQSDNLPNKFEIHITVEDLDGRQFMVLTQFDTGSSSNFITRGTLELLGRIKVHPIPSKEIIKYHSPIDGSGMAPNHLVFVRVWNEELNFFASEAKLRIIESNDVIQIIIGRKLMSKCSESGEISLLLARLEQLGNRPPNAEPSMNLIATLIKDPRSNGMDLRMKYHRNIYANDYDTEQRSFDAVMNEKHRQDFLERQKILESSKPRAFPGSMKYNGSGGHSSTNKMAEGVSAGHDNMPRYSAAASSAATDIHATATQQPDSLPICQGYHQDASQQVIPSNYAGFEDPRAEWQRRRAGTMSTQETYYTQFSLDRQSTTSTMSSWNGTLPPTCKMGAFTAAPRTEEGTAEEKCND